MFAYRILPLGGGTLTGGKNYSAASNETVEEERPWLHVNASSLLIRDSLDLLPSFIVPLCPRACLPPDDEANEMMVNLNHTFGRCSRFCCTRTPLLFFSSSPTLEFSGEHSYNNY